ncbi:MAG TPA: RNA polymerase sigma factor [Gaiellaceae bacterium]
MAISPAERDDGTSHDTEALYHEHGAAVAALCRSLLRDRGETEDATQQVFLSAHRALLNGASPREPRAWLLAVARNECYARFRDRASTPVPTGDAPEAATADASVHVLRAGELARVWDEVGQMPPTQREAFLLREIRGLSYGQVADELSLSGPSVRSLLLRARMRLRRRLGDVAAGLGGASWVQALFRLFAGGDAVSPVPTATKAAAVGIGALALAGGGGLVAHHAAQSPNRPAEHHRASARVQHVATPPVAAVASSEDRPRLDDRNSDVEHSRGRAGDVRESGERSRHGGGRSSGQSSSGSGDDASDDNAVAAQSPTSSEGPDGGGGSSSGPGPSDHASSGSGDSRSSGDSGSVTTPTSSGSDSGSSDSSGSDGSGSSGSSAGSDGGGSGSDGGSGHGG